MSPKFGMASKKPIKHCFETGMYPAYASDNLGCSTEIPLLALHWPVRWR